MSNYINSPAITDCMKSLFRWNTLCVIVGESLQSFGFNRGNAVISTITMIDNQTCVIAIIATVAPETFTGFIESSDFRHYIFLYLSASIFSGEILLDLIGNIVIGFTIDRLGNITYGVVLRRPVFYRNVCPIQSLSALC